MIVCGAAAKPAAPVGLRVNGGINPLAIERDAVRFTWMSSDTDRGFRQAAYQIVIATSAERLAAGNADWWDSGRVASEKSGGLEYAGKALPPAARFWWQVRIWDQAGQPGEYSAPGRFDTGLAPQEWTAQYIWDGTANQNNFAYFRKTFSLPRPPRLAKVYVTAHNDYQLYLNGQVLGRGPARSDPYFNGQYNAYDITPLLQPGANVLAAAGHWIGTWINSGVNAEPAFRLEARLQYADGSTLTIGTDSSWKVLAQTGFIETDPSYFSETTVRQKSRPNPSATRQEPPGGWVTDLDDPRWGSATVIVRAGPRATFTPYGGAGGSRNRAALRFDSRRDPVGWQAAAFDDAGWAAASVVKRPDYRLFAQMAPAVSAQAELEPVSVVPAGDAWLVDFGRCLNGWPKLTLHANQPGDAVRVAYFQMSGERKPAGWDEYHCSGGTETWQPDFGRHATFQVPKITGYVGTLRAADVRGIWAYCNSDPGGSFRCSSDLLNAIYDMCVRSARQNVQQGIISVDANREQSQWTADCWNIGNALLYNDRGTTVIDKIVRDYAAEQLPNGNFPACCPAHRSRCIPEWSMYWPMLLWQQYLFSGDEALLRAMAPRLARFLRWLGRFQDPTTQLVDPPGWRISEYAGGNLPSGGYNAATACQYYENLRIAAAAFAVLGDSAQGRDYARQAEALAAGINAHLFNGDFYLSRTDRQEMFPLASAWALRFDLVPATVKPRVLAAILAPGKSNLGGYGGDAFYSGVLRAGGGEFVVRDLVRYLPMLEGNQTNWEGFEPARGEANHAWTAYPGYLFQKYICGIQPTSGGFATFDVRPETGGLDFAEGTVPTIRGDITTRWEKSPSGRFMLSVGVPANTRAAVYLPKPGSAARLVTESGRQVWPRKDPVEGVLVVEDSPDALRCVVGGGTYRFEQEATPSR